MARDVGGGVASPESMSHALMCWFMRNSTATEKPCVAARGDLLPKILPRVDRSGDDDLSRVVVGRILVARKVTEVCSR